jgi:tripartite-type tricarboxylate transporter receptor subunit TctC
VVWYGVLFPVRTQLEIVNRMSAEVNRAVHAPDVKQKLLQQGVESVGTTPEQFAKFIQSETARYGRIIRESGAKPD